MGNGVEKKALDNGEKILLLEILNFVAAIFLLIVNFAPFNVNFYDLFLTEYKSNVLLVDLLIMGTILYALFRPFKKPQNLSLTHNCLGLGVGQKI